MNTYNNTEKKYTSHGRNEQQGLYNAEGKSVI